MIADAARCPQMLTSIHPLSFPPTSSTPAATGGTAELSPQYDSQNGGAAAGDSYQTPRINVSTAFDLIDRNGDGVLSRAEVIKALRDNADVRQLLHLPAHIRQEDISRTEFERVFQAIDTHESKTITRDEFEAYFSEGKRTSASERRTPPVPPVRQSAQARALVQPSALLQDVPATSITSSPVSYAAAPGRTVTQFSEARSAIFLQFGHCTTTNTLNIRKRTYWKTWRHGSLYLVRLFRGTTKAVRFSPVEVSPHLV